LQQQLDKATDINSIAAAWWLTT